MLRPALRVLPPPLHHSKQMGPCWLLPHERAARCCRVHRPHPVLHRSRQRLLLRVPAPSPCYRPSQRNLLEMYVLRLSCRPSMWPQRHLR